VRGDTVHARGWIAAVVVLVLIAAHAGLLRLVSRGNVSVVLVAAMAGLVVVKYAWRRFRG
jgi:hypothetical protein